MIRIRASKVMKNLKILVTGGYGYIGSMLVPELLSHGAQVTVIDNNLYQVNSLAACCMSNNLNIEMVDIRDTSVVQSFIEKNDVIIPLAALVGAPLCSRDKTGADSINRVAPLDMFKAVSSSQRVIMPTTNSAYGTGDGNNYCTEETPLRPISKYAVDKVEVEKALMDLQLSTSLRLATVFGMSPRLRLDLLVNDFTHRALKDGTLVLFEAHFKRNYIHVRDVVAAFIHCINNEAVTAGEIFNIGLSDANLSKAELCERIKKHLPNFVYMMADVGKDPDQRNYIVSNAKIENTGFKTVVSLDDGIGELIKGLACLSTKRFSNV